MSTILWNPESEADFTRFDTAIHAADEHIRAAKPAIENLYNINKGLTITALYNAFNGEVFPQWQANFSSLAVFLNQLQTSYQAAMQQDAENAGRISQ